MSPYEELRQAVLRYKEAWEVRDTKPYVTGNWDKSLDRRDELFALATKEERDV
jgi:hypothetical protein